MFQRALRAPLTSNFSPFCLFSFAISPASKGVCLIDNIYYVTIYKSRPHRGFEQLDEKMALNLRDIYDSGHLEVKVIPNEQWLHVQSVGAVSLSTRQVQTLIDFVQERLFDLQEGQYVTTDEANGWMVGKGVDDNGCPSLCIDAGACMFRTDAQRFIMELEKHCAYKE